MRRRTRLALGLGALSLMTTACAGTIVRLTEAGSYEEAIAKAESRRVPPKGRAARAYAEALTKTEQHDQARAVLLSDYRHGGDLRSLVALADLEHELGLDGIAASHYGRIADLSHGALAGRQDVCALLVRRATRWANEGAGLAAERDLERRTAVCGEPAGVAEAAELSALETKVHAAAQARIDARIEAGQCGDECDEAQLEQAREHRAAALADAREAGPAALRRAATRQRVQLAPEEIVAIVLADLSGKAGDTLVTDDEVRAWVGEQSWAMLAPAVMTQAPEVAAYLQLRLAAVVDDVPVTLRSRTGPGELDVWLAQSMEMNGDDAWRILAWAGDLTGVELALGSVWRPKTRRPKPEAAEAEPAAGEDPPAVEQPEPVVPEAVDGVEPPRHWTSRVEITDVSVPVLFVEARLRYLARHEARSLEIQRYTAARGVAAGLEGIDGHVAREAAWHLAHGRPWHALALAESVERPQSQRVANAAATALRLTEAFCGGPCNEDRDLDRVELALGEEWVQAQRTQLVARSRMRTEAATSVDACPTLGELLASDATGRLSEALVGAREAPRAPGQARRLREAIEADLSLGCAGRYVVPLLREAGFVATADAMAESLAHDANLEAPRALAMHSALAMVGDRRDMADLLATAAGAVSDEPAEIWRSLARDAHATGHRELTLRALREALLHTPGFDDPAIQRALVVAVLAGIDDGWNLREAPAGAMEPASHVRDFVDRAPEQTRWARREELARALARQSWFDADARVRLEPALWPDPTMARSHRIARAWLGLASGTAPDLEPADVGPFDLAAQELLLTLRKQDALPAATVAFVEPPQMEAARLALAEHSRTWVLRWRTAIGLAVYGSRQGRTRALGQLLSMAEPAARDALVAVLLEDPAVVQPGADGGLDESAILITPEDQLSVVLDLPADPLGL
ncbi:MAG: hypothetical protein AAF799_40690 [Myxococcota bacterium]